MTPILQLRCLSETADERVELAGLVPCKDARQHMKLWATAVECVWQVVTAGAKNVEHQGLTQLRGTQAWSALVFFLGGTPTQASALEMLKEFYAAKVREVVFEEMTLRGKAHMLSFQE